jgi:DNA-binding response OmpR family regulator
MITGMVDDASRKRALSAGTVDVIAKPVVRADIVARVKKALFRTSGDPGD